MRSSSPLYIILTFMGLSSVVAVPNPMQADVALCDGQVTLSETFIGKAQNVKVQHIYCGSQNKSVLPSPVLDVRQITSTIAPPATAVNTAPSSGPTDVCGANCATHCFLPSGGGPNPYDCKFIADSLPSNAGFTLDPGYALILSYRTCTTFFRNQASTQLSYCDSAMSSLINYLAFNCQSQQNAHGGLCVANDQRWFVQVQHS